MHQARKWTLVFGVACLLTISIELNQDYPGDLLNSHTSIAPTTNDRLKTDPAPSDNSNKAQIVDCYVPTSTSTEAAQDELDKYERLQKSILKQFSKSQIEDLVVLARLTHINNYKIPLEAVKLYERRHALQDKMDEQWLAINKQLEKYER